MQEAAARATLAFVATQLLVQDEEEEEEEEEDGGQGTSRGTFPVEEETIDK